MLSLTSHRGVPANRMVKCDAEPTDVTGHMLLSFYHGIKVRSKYPTIPTESLPAPGFLLSATRG